MAARMAVRTAIRMVNDIVLLCSSPDFEIYLVKVPVYRPESCSYAGTACEGSSCGRYSGSDGFRWNRGRVRQHWCTWSANWSTSFPAGCPTSCLRHPLRESKTRTHFEKNACHSTLVAVQMVLLLTPDAAAAAAAADAV